MASTCRLTTLVLDFSGRWKLSDADADAAKLGVVLAQCPALEHLALMGITIARTKTAAFHVVARGRIRDVCARRMRIRRAPQSR